MTLPPGDSRLTLDLDAGQRISLWLHRPATWHRDAPVLIVMHGYRRNADRYRDDWRATAARLGLLLVAPEMDQTAFPGAGAYEVGGLRTPDRSAFRPPEQWSFATVEAAFDLVVAESGSRRPGYRLFGHSAGGQFVHRMVLFCPHARIERAVAANAGAYTLPRTDTPFPFGFGGLPGPPDRAAAFARELIVLLGERDSNPAAAKLLTTPRALEQGPHRLARGCHFYAVSRRLAEKAGLPFNWRLVTVPGVGHSNRKLAPVAGLLLS